MEGGAAVCCVAIEVPGAAALCVKLENVALHLEPSGRVSLNYCSSGGSA